LMSQNKSIPQADPLKRAEGRGRQDARELQHIKPTRCSIEFEYRGSLAVS